MSETSDFKLTPEIMAVLRKCDPNIRTENLNFSSLEDIWDYLKKEEQKIDAKLNECKSKDVNLHEHMVQLHKYNEIKDITQVVLGQLANRLNISVVEVHRKFDLDSL